MAPLFLNNGHVLISLIINLFYNKFHYKVFIF